MGDIPFIISDQNPFDEIIHKVFVGRRSFPQVEANGNLPCQSDDQLLIFTIEHIGLHINQGSVDDSLSDFVCNFANFCNIRKHTHRRFQPEISSEILVSPLTTTRFNPEFS
jgi:hypothetical protein